MEKPADTGHPINELIARRWSPRAFADKPVEPATLARLFEAARWASSSFNEQPWKFVVATRQDPEAHQVLADCLVEGNRIWAVEAPILTMSIAKLNFTHKERPNRHAYFDLGQAVATMLVQATDLGLVAHQMAGFDADKARASLEIPDDHDPVAAMALGYPAAAAELPDDLLERENARRRRNDLGDFVFAGTFGSAMPLE